MTRAVRFAAAAVVTRAVHFAAATAVAAALSVVCPPTAARAHSASDAYLSLTAADAGGRSGSTLHGQWDIALRDLDFVLHLDDDGDGRLTWKEVRGHRAQIDKYAYPALRLSGAQSRECVIRPLEQLIDEHADGAYAVLKFDVVCRHEIARGLRLGYGLFFAVDPSHRAIVTLQSAAGVGTAVLSPQNAQLELAP